MKNAMWGLAALTLLGGCSGGKKEEAHGGKEAPKGHFVIRSSIPDDVKGEDRQKMQSEIIDLMADNPLVDLDAYRGEASRRGVALTDAQIARKKASSARGGQPPAVSAQPAAPQPAPAS